MSLVTFEFFLSFSPQQRNTLTEDAAGEAGKDAQSRAEEADDSACELGEGEFGVKKKKKSFSVVVVVAADCLFLLFSSLSFYL